MTHPPGGTEVRAAPEFDPWRNTTADVAPARAEPAGGRRRTRLLAGVAGAVIVLAGGTTAFVLAAGGHDTPVPAQNEPETGPVAVTAATPAGVAQAALDAYLNRSATQYVALLCRTPGPRQMADIQGRLATATELSGSVIGQPAVTGTTATVEVSLDYNGQREKPRITMRQQGRKWCIDEP